MERFIKKSENYYIENFTNKSLKSKYYNNYLFKKSSKEEKKIINPIRSFELNYEDVYSNEKTNFNFAEKNGDILFSKSNSIYLLNVINKKEYKKIYQSIFLINNLTFFKDDFLVYSSEKKFYLFDIKSEKNIFSKETEFFGNISILKSDKNKNFDNLLFIGNNLGKVQIYDLRLKKNLIGSMEHKKCQNCKIKKIKFFNNLMASSCNKKSIFSMDLRNMEKCYFNYKRKIKINNFDFFSENKIFVFSKNKNYFCFINFFNSETQFVHFDHILDFSFFVKDNKKFFHFFKNIDDSLVGSFNVMNHNKKFNKDYNFQNIFNYDKNFGNKTDFSCFHYDSKNLIVINSHDFIYSFELKNI